MPTQHRENPFVLGLIIARGGSVGLPRKNILPLAGKPLIAWTIDAARASHLTRLIVSTDDNEIAATAQECGAEVPFTRPAKLAQGDSDSMSVVLHTLDWFDRQEAAMPDYIVLLQPTAPLRLAADIDAAVEMAVRHGAEAVIGVTEARNHPYLTYQFNMNGTIQPFMDPVGLGYLRRQDLPAAFVINGAIYVNTPTSLRQHRTFTPPGALGYVMPPERSVDIDTALDLRIAELLIRDRENPPHAH